MLFRQNTYSYRKIIKYVLNEEKKNHVQKQNTFNTQDISSENSINESCIKARSAGILVFRLYLQCKYICNK